MNATYSTKAYGKWILSGEHAVLRGCPALVFPLYSRVLELTYHKSEEPLQINLDGDCGEELQVLVRSLLDKALKYKNKEHSMLVGRLNFKSNIPVGAGMGASAALCVVLTRWLVFLGVVHENDIYDFAKQLEDLFHGESSGVDIAVSMSSKGLYFVRNGERRSFEMKWSPKWFISYSGKKGMTKECVNTVKEWINLNETLGERVDQEMRLATNLCSEALLSNEKIGFDLLVKGIEKAQWCFEQWGLVDEPVRKHMQWLSESGALATKLTGSGGGGYVLSLWKESPPQDILGELIPC